MHIHSFAQIALKYDLLSLPVLFVTTAPVWNIDISIDIYFKNEESMLYIYDIYSHTHISNLFLNHFTC